MTVPHPLPRRFAFMTAGALVLIGLTGLAPLPEQPEELPEGVRPITKDQFLEKVPNFFYFDYPFEPEPGKRLWLRIDRKFFVERYPSGLEARFRIVGRTRVNGVDGTMVVKVYGDEEKTQTRNDKSLQTFIPDRGAAKMNLLFRRTGDTKGEWTDLGEIKKVE